MKKFIVITILLILVGFSCNRLSKENAAQLLIKETLINTMVYPDSYEGVSFGTLDSIYSRIENDSVYIALESILTKLITQKEKVEKKIAKNKKSKDNLNQLSFFATIHTPYVDKERGVLNKRLDMYKFQIDSLRQKVDSIRANFKPAFIGYTMTHRFKYLSRAGFVKESPTVFYIDPNISIVTKFKDDFGLLLEYNSLTNKYEPK